MTEREFWEEDKPRRRRKNRLVFRLSDRLWPLSWNPFLRDLLTGAVIGVLVSGAVVGVIWLVVK